MQEGYLKRNKEYLIFLSIIAGAIIILGFISPIIVNNQSKNWKDKVENKVYDIEFNVIKDFEGKYNSITSAVNSLKLNLQPILTGGNPDQAKIFSVIDSSINYNYTIQIFAEDSTLIAWNGVTFQPEEIFYPQIFHFGEVYFYTHKLFTYLTLTDTIDVSGSKIYLNVSLPVEKHYSLKNRFYKKLSFNQYFSEKYETKFWIQYSAFEMQTKDGRNFSFDLLNNFHNKIGVVTFRKPSLSNTLDDTEEAVASIQAILVLLGYFVIGFLLLQAVTTVKSKILKILILTSYTAVLRYLLFTFNLPNKFMSSELTNNDYFSSNFAFGSVHSPIDLFISISMLLLICYFVYKYTIESSELRKVYKLKPNLLTGIIVLSVILFLIIMRGFEASIRSVIFDSSLRYFKDVSLVPGVPIFMMDINIMLLGVCLILVSVSIFLILFSMHSDKGERLKFSYIVILFLIFQFSGVIFDAVQELPQGTPLIRIIFITLTFLLAYFIFYNKKSLVNFVYFAFVSSVISISLLNFYNSELERESLKTTALQLIRPNENLLEFMIRKTLTIASRSDLAVETFLSNDKNYESNAFRIWSESPLYDEDASCEINFISKDKKNLGGFSINFEDFFASGWMIFGEVNDEIKIVSEDVLYSDSKIIRGIMPAKYKGTLLGYIEVGVLYDVDSFEFGIVPEFLANTKVSINSMVDFEKLNIFDFHDGELINYLAEFSLRPEEANKLKSVKFNKFNEAWLTTSLNNELHRVYIVKSSQDNLERILAVALKEKDVSWSLFNFFKVFFIHSLIIVLLIALYLIFSYGRRKELKIGFRTKLIISFLVISIIPLILLAGYFRFLTEDKNSDAKLYKLGKRAFSVESYVNSYLGESTENAFTIFKNASKDLGINFSIFYKDKQIFSSKDEYYEIGLIPDKLNPMAYKALYLKGEKEFVIDEKIENYKFSSFYYRGMIGNEEYVFKVSNVFNNIMLPLSDVEINIFIFGSYSLAVIFLVIFSTLLANQISSPIRRLTNATSSVAGGDLNIELAEYEKGEIGDLIRGFNMMVRDVKKSQAQLADLERETAWKEMAKQVAHEIKNPLTPMKLSVQQLSAAYEDKSPKFDSIFKKVTHTLISQIETLKNIASEFSNFARMPRLKVENVNLMNIIRDSSNLFSQENVAINIADDFEKADIIADRDQLKRTIINLIRNAVQAGSTVVNFIMSENSENYFVKIIDNGRGIPDEIKDKVFENNFTTKVEGMGIGLNLARKYIRNINGSISVESTSKNGTTILLTFNKIGF